MSPHRKRSRSESISASASHKVLANRAKAMGILRPGQSAAPFSTEQLSGMIASRRRP